MLDEGVGFADRYGWFYRQGAFANELLIKQLVGLLLHYFKIEAIYVIDFDRLFVRSIKGRALAAAEEHKHTAAHNDEQDDGESRNELIL